MNNFFREKDREISFSKRNILNFPPHIHSDIELVYIKKGSTKAFCNGEEYLIKENDIFIAFPNQVHHYSDCSTDCESLLYIINPYLLKDYTDFFIKSTPISPVYTPTKNDCILYSLLELSFDEYQINQDKKIIYSLTNAILGKLLLGYSFYDINTSNTSVSKILQYCSDHYHEELTVKEISQRLNISQSHISHTFNNKLHVKFCDYVNSLRLIEAAKLLRGGKHTVTEISYLCGFGTIRTFNRVFYKHYGQTPSKYKKISCK